MNFLGKLIFALGIVGRLAAAPYADVRDVPVGSDSVHLESIEGTNLNHAYTIANPYNESVDKPFTITTKTVEAAPAPAASKVSCGGRIWTDGEVLGHTGDGKSMITRIQDNRVYANWGGTVTDNIFVLFYLVEGTFPNTPENGRLIDACVNPLDPSTNTVQLLGKNSNGEITCNGYVMSPGDWLGTYIADWGETRHFVRVVDGLLRISIQQGPNDNNTTNLNMSLMNFVVDGANGSYLAPKWRGVLTRDMVNGCFWPRVPKPATPIADVNCASGPTVGTISNISTTGLRFSYSGSGVSTIKWKILSGTNTVASGTTGNLSSNNVDLGFASLAPGSYKLSIEGANCISGQSEKTFTIPVPDPTACISGPNLETVTNITPTGLRFIFNGLGVNTIKWKILSGANTVANGTTPNLTSSNVDITYGTLAAGNYKLSIEGGSCISSASELSFTVAGSGPQNCASGPTLTGVTNVSTTGLTFTYSGNGVSTVKWKILSGINSVASGTTGTLTGNTGNLTFASLAAGSYKLVIEGGNCTSASSEQTFTVTTGIPSCISGPNLESVTNVSATGLSFTFNGLGVSTIKWKILSGTNNVASGTTGNLTSANVDITYSSLASGNYKLVIEGGSCTSSTSELSFTVPVVGPQPCASGPTLQNVTNVSQTGLTFSFAGSGVSKINWKILSGVTTSASGTTGTLTGTSANLTFASLAPGSYKLSIEGGNCTSSTSELSFTVPTAGPQPCTQGPILNTVSNVSATGLNFTFNGIGVSTIKWKILSGANTVANGTTGTLSSSSVNLTFASLASGSYKLVIEGGACTSATSELSFTVPTSGPQPCASGPTLQNVSNVTPTGLTFSFTGSGVSTIKWKILSGVTTSASGTTGTLSGTTANLTFASLAEGNYKLVIEGGNCTSSTSELSFTVVTGIPSCIAGPNLESISNVTATGLQFVFNGLGVNTIKWKILSGTTTVATNTTANLTSSVVNISYSTLAAGNYKLVIEGGSCTSATSELSFTVATTGPQPCASGPTLQNVTNVSQTGLTFSFAGSGVSKIKWKILSGATTSASGTTGTLTGTSANLTFASLAAGSYKLVIQGSNCTSSTSELTFTVPTTGPQPCTSGPTLKTVTNVTATGLRFTFDAVGVTNIKWKILSGSTTVANATTPTLTSSTVDITYATLAPGNYKLVIEGGACTSGTTELAFTLTNGLPQPCASAPIVQSVTNVTTTSLTFGYSGSGVTSLKWKILSGITTVASGTTGTLSGNTGNLTFDALIAGEYKLVIEGGNCTSASSELRFAVVTGIPKCISGPTLESVSNVTSTGLRFVFNGLGVSTIKWKIVSGTTTVATNTTAELTSSTVNISYSTLAAGSYKLVIEGSSCTSSTSELSFTVAGSGIQPCASGPTLQNVSNVSQTGLTFTFAGSGVSTIKWKILSGATTSASGTTGTLTGTSANLTFASLSPGSYKLVLEGGNCTSATSELSFTVPTPGTSPCAKGPNLVALTDPTSTSLKFQFDGINVSAIDWKIMKGSTMMRSNRVEPRSNTPQISYTALADGDYTLQIQGGNCTSAVSSANFKLGGSLPIYVSNFKAQAREGSVELAWEVVSEQDGKEFEVLRYDDKVKNAETLGKVSLTDQRVGWYSFTDEKPLLGINYYQLKQIDVDGRFEKSKVISVNPGIITHRVAAPNPAQDYVDIQFHSRTAGLSNVSIYNIAGLRVSSSEIQIHEGANSHRLDVKRFDIGSYIIKIQHGGEVSKLRFMKVN
ncbi:T9SS type A sorting domain-containing protein [Dyadobacter luticola]|uniref:T9SS type A sorting domain-containing protein n=1 Tax=Dyadobacter luticola TaxID=1979387 RepID=A0A5R9KSF7_9BACT|nr:T9SS type A sorting domain-containing protein [Dyadobacter luticola]TLU99153.1 T9SS type A sorting domain-containing protein [Dyadobacter luticola]